MTRVGHDHVLRLGPRAVQIVGAANRADDVVSALDDRTWNIAQPRHAFEQRVSGQEEAVHEVVRLDAGDCQRGSILVEVCDQVGIGQQRGARALVAAPGVRRWHMDGGIGMGQSAVIAAEEIAAFRLRQEACKRAPSFWKKEADVVHEPADLQRPAQKDAA